MGADAFCLAGGALELVEAILEVVDALATGPLKNDEDEDRDAEDGEEGGFHKRMEMSMPRRMA